MKITWGEIHVCADDKLKVIDITQDVKEIAENAQVKDAVVTVFNPHVTSAVCVNEHDPELWKDLLQAYERLVPLRAGYRHNARYNGIPGEQNAHAHILNTLIGQSVSLPLRDGKLIMGTWQSILFIELDGGKRRTLTVQVTGE